MGKEIWKDIKGFEGFYKISNLGNVKSVTRLVKSKGNSFKKLKSCSIKNHKNKLGYLRVVLWKNSKSFNFSVHRLVGVAFIKNPENKKQINHIDGDKTNNKVDNLEWSTAAENNQHAFKIGIKKGVRGEKNHNSKLTQDQVNEIRAIGKQMKQYEIAEIYGVNRRHISRILNGKRWNYKKIK